MTPELARTAAEAWVTKEPAKRAEVLRCAHINVRSAVMIAMEIDRIYGPKAGAQYLREFLRAVAAPASV